MRALQAGTVTRRLALVTGGTSGIGWSVARLLAEDHDLALAYAQDHARAAGAHDDLGATPARVELLPGRLRGYEDAGRLMAEVETRFGRAPAVLVHAAGGIDDSLFLGSDFASHAERVHEHLLVAMALAHLVLRPMYRDRFGRIVSISSISARYAKRGQCGYAAAKAGLEGFTRVLALEVAHRGITVNAVAPGLIDTPLAAGAVERLRARGGPHPIPVGRVGQPGEVAQLVKFLCSDQAGYITGAVCTIDGGRSLGDPTL